MSSDTTSILPQRNLNPANSNGVSAAYEFGDFRLDPARLMLYSAGQPVQLAPKVVETLLALVERHGEVVGKKELMERLWAGVAVEEANLTQNIYLLRKTLGGGADGRPMIETFRRRGYRFNGEVRRDGGREAQIVLATHTKTHVTTEEFVIEPERSDATPTAGAGGMATREPDAAATPRVRVQGSRKVHAVVLFCGVLMLGVLGAARLFQRGERSRTPAAQPRAAAITFKRLTPEIHADSPTLSPDGRYLAYAKWEDEKRGVWLKDVATGGAKQIMPATTEGYEALQFSPDGSRIYYATSRRGVPNAIIARVPVEGGMAQEIARNAISPFTLSPDERHIAFMNPNGLVIAAIDGTEERVVASRRSGETGWFESWGSQMSWSPGGKTIAVCGNRMEGGRKRVELLEISIDDGTEKHIPVPDWDYLDDVQWLADRSGLLIIARETSGSPFQIWHVAYPHGQTSRVTNDFHNYRSMSLSADSRLLVAEQEIGQINIWAVPLADAGRAKQLTFGTAARHGTRGLAVAPDGRIVFTSPRSGSLDLWSVSLDGGDPKQLTGGGGENLSPRFSPDGRHVVFVSTRTGKPRIWRMDADGGNPKQLTDDGYHEKDPVISPDGWWVYYTREDGAVATVWKVSIDGGEPARVSVHERAGALSVSPDNKLLAYDHYEEGSPTPWKLGVMSVKTGETIRTFDVPFWRTVHWTPDSKALIYVSHFSNLWQQSLDGGPPRRLTDFDAGHIRYFDISPDHKTLVLSRGNVTTEAILIQNFHPTALPDAR